MLIIFLIFLFLCWGSFLNVIAYRLINGYSILGINRSFCPKCHETLAWYDLIPIISFFILKAKCRHCKKTISWLYPFIELLSAILLTLIIYLIPKEYWLGYIIFFSGLIISTRTDLESMLISRLSTLGLIPVAYILSTFNFLEVSLIESIIGSVFGFGLLWLISNIFYKLKKQQGIGEGDFDLLAFIGAFIGPMGVWITIFLASIFATIISLPIIIYKKNIRAIKIPFAPFLSLGAACYVLFKNYLINLLIKF